MEAARHHEDARRWDLEIHGKPLDDPASFVGGVPCKTNRQSETHATADDEGVMESLQETGHSTASDWIVGAVVGVGRRVAPLGDPVGGHEVDRSVERVRVRDVLKLV